MKLYKLLFLLDFESHRQFGRSVTGLSYQAWRMGPVPIDLHREWLDGLHQPLSAGLVPERVRTQFDYDSDDGNGFESEKLVKRIDFESRFFSPAEFQIMNEIAKKYFAHTATQMSVESHEAFGIWDHVWNTLNRPNGDIPYSLVFDRQDSERDKLVRGIADEKMRFTRTSA